MCFVVMIVFGGYRRIRTYNVSSVSDLQSPPFASLDRYPFSYLLQKVSFKDRVKNRKNRHFVFPTIDVWFECDRIILFRISMVVVEQVFLIILRKIENMRSSTSINSRNDGVHS